MITSENLEYSLTNSLLWYHQVTKGTKNNFYLMLHKLILKVTKFQLPPPKRLSTVVKNISGEGHDPCQIG